MTEDFPRGGAEAKEVNEKKTKKRRREDDQAQDHSKSDLFLVKPKKAKFIKPISEKQTPTSEEAKPKRDRSEKRTHEKETAFGEIVAPGILVLGCVREVRDFELIVSLPNSLKGTVAITDICDAYTDLLQKLAEGNDADLVEDKSLLSLHDLFHVGSVVRCKVKEVNMKGKTKQMRLTLNPKEVNRNISVLTNKTVLTGCISSCEDHGYLIDLGHKVKAFLKKDDAAAYLKKIGSEDARLSVGSYFHCVVHSNKKSEGSQVVKISVDPDHVHEALLQTSMELSVPALLPGFVADATVTKVAENSLNVELMSFSGTIYKHHLQRAVKSYEVGAEIRVAILFVNSITKVLALTELPHLVSPNFMPTKLFDNLCVGEIMEEAVVTSVNEKLGVYFKFPGNLKAFARIAQLPTDSLKSMHQSYPKGSTHRCRIMNFDYLSKVVFVSLKENILDLEFFGYSDVKPGMLLECTVDKLTAHGAAVNVTKHIRGFVPKMHLADVPLEKPEKKFYRNKTVKCRVLVVDKEKMKLLLTCKKSLIKSELPIITSFQQCKRGTTMDGFVASIKQNGLLVVFFNNVKGWVPKNEASIDDVDLQRNFYLGQVVKCRVTNCDMDEPKLFLSLKVQTKPAKTAKKQVIPADIVVGKVSSCIVRKVEGSELKVEVADNVLASLPKAHLSDYASNVGQLHKMFREGDVIDQVMVINKRHSALTVTKKASVIQCSLDGNLVTDFSLLQPGMMLPGVAKKKMTYGMFVDINGLTGLVPRKYMVDGNLPDPLSLFHEGQSLIPKVTEVDKETKRFLLSLRMTDCYHGDTNVGISLMEKYFEEHQMILDHLKLAGGVQSELGNLVIGSVVSVKITNVNDKGVLCVMANGVKGFATLENMAGFVCQVDEEHEAVVLVVDVEAECVQLSFSRDLVNAVKKYVDNKYSKARVDQVIKSEVHMVTENYVVVMLKAHAVGRIAFLPAKKHLNDVVEKAQYHVGQVNPVVIKKECGDKIFASLQIHENASKTMLSKSGLPNIGTVVSARISKVYPMQLNVNVGGYPGRVHITEILDDIPTGTSPLHSFSEGKDVMVKVIGYREEKTHKYISRDRARGVRVLLECTVKPSKMSSDVIEELLIPKINVGDKVTGFVISLEKNCIQMQVTRTMKGTVHILNASDKIKTLSGAEGHFKVGHGFKATVLEVREDSLEMTIAGRTGIVKAGDVLPAIILKLIPNRGLLLQLPHRQVADVHLTQLSDHYLDFQQHSYKENQFVKCRVLSSNVVGPRTKCVATLRKSKFENTEAEIVDKEILSFDDLKQGDICRGYVVSSRDNNILVSFGPEITGHVKRNRLSKYFITDVKSIFHPGKVVTAKILSMDRNSKHLELSLLEKDTLVSEAIPADVAKDLSLKKIDESSEQAMECEPVPSAKPFLKLFTQKNQKSPTKKADMASEKPITECGSFWTDKFAAPESDVDEEGSDDAVDDDMQLD